MTRTDGFQRWLPWSIVVLSVLTALIVFTGIFPGIRPILILVFFATCPGFPYIHLLNLRDFLTELVLMIALSLVIDATVAMILLYTGAWSYVTGLLILIGISLAGVGLNIRQMRRAERVPSLNKPRERFAKLPPPLLPLATASQASRVSGAQLESELESQFSIPEITEAQKSVETQTQVEPEVKPKKVTRRRSKKTIDKEVAVPVFETPASSMPEAKPARASRRPKKATASEDSSLATSTEQTPVTESPAEEGLPAKAEPKPVKKKNKSTKGTNQDNNQLVLSEPAEIALESQAETEPPKVEEAKPAKTLRKTTRRSKSTAKPENISQSLGEEQTASSKPVRRKRSRKVKPEDPS